MRTRLGYLVLVGVFALTACGASDEPDNAGEVPDKDWAMSLCKRKVNNGLEDDAGKPAQPMTVLRARPVSVKDAAKLPGADVELGIGEQADGYLASCKVQFVDADLSTMPWPEEAAVLVSERGDVTFVVDRF